MEEQNKLWLPARFGRRHLIMGAGAAAILAACGTANSESAAPAGPTNLAANDPRNARYTIFDSAGAVLAWALAQRASGKANTAEQSAFAVDEREARTRLRPLKRQAEAAELHERLERGPVRAAIERFGLEDAVRFENDVDWARLIELYSEAEVAVLINEWTQVLDCNDRLFVVS